jgi:hypothetical protein
MRKKKKVKKESWEYQWEDLPELAEDLVIDKNPGVISRFQYERVWAGGCEDFLYWPAGAKVLAFVDPFKKVKIELEYEESDV